MPDITMCPGKGCPIEETCYRYRAYPNPKWQSYFVAPPYKDDKCEEFIKFRDPSHTSREDSLQELTELTEEMGLYE